jgi:heat shock protein HslJ
MAPLRPVPTSALFLVAAVLTACGGDASSGTAGDSFGALTTDDLGGTAYLSASVDGHDVVPGSRIRLSFEDGRMAAIAGCNSMTGPYDVTDGQLAWTSGPAATQIGCRQEMMRQDEWLADLLTAGVDATLDGDALTLSTGDVTIHLQRETPVEAATLFGHTLTVTELTTPTTSSALPDGVRSPTLKIATDGTVNLDTGCNRGRTTATAGGDVLTFEPPVTTKLACTPPAGAVEHAVLQALEGLAIVTVDGSTATLSNGRHGLVVDVGPRQG